MGSRQVTWVVPHKTKLGYRTDNDYDNDTMNSLDWQKYVTGDIVNSHV